MKTITIQIKELVNGANLCLENVERVEKNITGSYLKSSYRGSHSAAFWAIFAL